ncbi:DNA ligase 1 [Procambarus clarkii]|uniref:DNA ligase 1 n=1 Tax=Procambarus clarkii TaxID=6728 RepID=UPI001E6703F8|nr:myb-like protein V [Procambarus clarkii]
MVAEMKVLQDIGIYFEPYFLGKWNLDRDFPKIPANKLHMPILRSHTRKNTAENHGIANLSVTFGKPSKRVTENVQRVDILFKIVTPEKQKETRGTGCEKKVNTFQTIGTPAGENSKDLSSPEMLRERSQTTHNKENAVELRRPSKRKAARDATLLLKEITNQIKNTKKNTTKRLNENKDISKDGDLIQIEQNEQEKSKRQRIKEDNPTWNEEEKSCRQKSKKEHPTVNETKLSKKRRSKEENPILKEHKNSKQHRLKKDIPSPNGIEKSYVSGSKEDHPAQCERELSKRQRSKKQNLTLNEQEKIEVQINVVKQKKNKKGQQVCGDEIEGGQENANKAVRKHNECNKPEKDTSVQITRGRTCKGRKFLVEDSDNEVNITWVESDNEDRDATWVASDNGGKKRRKNIGVKNDNKTQKIAGKNITASKGKDNESVKKQGSKQGSNLSLSEQAKCKAERVKATKVPQEGKETNKRKKTSEENCKEPRKPEDVEVSAKRGTLKYLLQREEFLKAQAQEIEVDDDFFADEIFKKKKNDLGKFLVSSSHDDSLIIKTPKIKGKTIPDNVITPRTEILGRFGASTPSTTPFTPSTSFPTSVTKSGHRKAVLEVMYHQLQGGKKRPRGIRKALHDSKQFGNSALVKPSNLPLLELPKFADDDENDTSIDDYFNTSDAF